MANGFWSAKTVGFFEHLCSPQRVPYTSIITSKSAKIRCDNCKEEYFYRLVPLNTFTVPQKQFINDIKQGFDEIREERMKEIEERINDNNRTPLV